MGSSSSRLGSRHHRTPRRPKHSRLLSVLVCGGGGASSSHSSTLEMDGDPAEVLMTSAQCRNPVSGKFQRSKKESVLVSEAEHGFSIPQIEQASSSEADFRATENPRADNNSDSVETNNHRKALCRSKDVMSPHQLGIDYRFRDIASTSYEDRRPSGPILENGRDDLDVAISVDDIIDNNLPQSCSVVTQTCISDSCSDGLSIENHASEVTAIHDFDSGSLSAVSDFPIDFDMQSNDTQDATTLGLGFAVSDGEQVLRDESLLHLDVLSLSPNTLSNSGADNSNHEARHSSRRLFWDAFSRRSSRRRSDSRTLVFTSEDSDDLGSQDRWLFDFNGEYLNDGVGGGTGTLGSRTNNLNDRHWHSNSEVLDEIHRQPLSLSLPIVSLPASESIVDSLPLKNHRKTHTTDDDEEQCYICLAEYEDGDKIRILPCHHEYHMVCVDKWLKEIHGVCPLCRGDVREMDASASNTEIPSL